MKKLYFLAILLFTTQLLPAQTTPGENLEIAVELFDKKEYEVSLLFCNKTRDMDPNLPDV